MWLFSLFPQQLHGVFSLSLSISASFILFAISFSVYSEFTLVKRRKIIPNFWETLPNKQRYLGHHKIGIVHNVSTLATVLLVSLQVMCTAYAVWYCTFSALIGFRFSLALFSASFVWFFVLFFSLAFSLFFFIAVVVVVFIDIISLALHEITLCWNHLTFSINENYMNTDKNRIVEFPTISEYIRWIVK